MSLFLIINLYNYYINMDHINNSNFKNNDDTNNNDTNNNDTDNNDTITEDTPKITIIFEEDLRNSNKTEQHPFNLLFTNLLKNIDKESKNIKIEYDIDYYSSIGNIKCLDNWFNKNFKNNKLVIDDNDYSNNAIDNASHNNKLNSLNWWLDKYNIYSILLKYSNNAIFNASKNEHIKCLEWWLSSNLELKYDNACIDIASSTGKLDMLDWWYSKYISNKLKFEYSSNCIDDTQLDEDKLLDVIKWWDTHIKIEKLKNNLFFNFKYTEKFINYVLKSKYNNVKKYLIDNNMANFDQKIFFESKESKPSKLFNLLDLINGTIPKKNTHKVNKNTLPIEIQEHIKEKEEELNNNMLMNGKVKEYIDNLVKIPFGKYRHENIFKFIHDLISKLNIYNNKLNLLKTDTVKNESDLIIFFKNIKFLNNITFKNIKNIVMFVLNI